MRILSWNVCGDNSDTAQFKMNELVRIINYWDEKEDPIVVICLQEIAANGLSKKILEERGFIVFVQGEQGGQKRNSLIAVRNIYSINKIEYDTKRYGEDRVPLIVRADNNCMIATYHAPVDKPCSQRDECLRVLEEELKQYEHVIVAGDLNIITDEETGDFCLNNYNPIQVKYFMDIMEYTIIMTT